MSKKMKLGYKRERERKKLFYLVMAASFVVPLYFSFYKCKLPLFLLHAYTVLILTLLLFFKLLFSLETFIKSNAFAQLRVVCQLLFSGSWGPVFSHSRSHQLLLRLWQHALHGATLEENLKTTVGPDGCSTESFGGS